MSPSLVDYADSEDETIVQPQVKRCKETIGTLYVNCAPRSPSCPRPQNNTQRDSFVSPTTAPLSQDTNVVTLGTVSRLCINDEPGPPAFNAEDILNTFQKSVAKLQQLRQSGRTINDYIRNSSDYQNPYCLEKIMELCNVSPYSSNFPCHICDSRYIALWEEPRFRRLMAQINKDTPSDVPRSSAKSSSSRITQKTSKNDEIARNVRSPKEPPVDDPHGRYETASTAPKLPHLQKSKLKTVSPHAFRHARWK